MKIAFKVIVFFTFLTGIAYPLFVTGISQILFTKNSNGQLIKKNGELIGSVLIGQKFAKSIYFSGRPSAVNYESKLSGATNLSPISKKLKVEIEERRKHFQSEDLLTSSASGLDPHITPNAALEQLNIVANARSYDSAKKQKLKQLIFELTEGRTLGFLGMPRINVLKLNIKLDEL